MEPGQLPVLVLRIGLAHAVLEREAEDGRTIFCETRGRKPLG
jgi:hypothetical protein